MTATSNQSESLTNVSLTLWDPNQATQQLILTMPPVEDSPLQLKAIFLYNRHEIPTGTTCRYLSIKINK